MDVEEIKRNAIEICRKHILALGTINVIIPEPYIPFIPENWKGTLVIAEAQNLSGKTGGDYRKGLEKASTEDRILRLYRFKDMVGKNIEPKASDNLGIEPWDDSSLKLAIVAALGATIEETGVSNAVPWSQQAPEGFNVTPSPELQKKSEPFWKEMLDTLKPGLVVASGNVAQNIIGKVWHGNLIKWRLPSRQAMSRISGMFPDILERYEEVRKVISQRPELMKSLDYMQNKIFFACHAVTSRYVSTPSIAISATSKPFSSR